MGHGPAHQHTACSAPCCTIVARCYLNNAAWAAYRLEASTRGAENEREEPGDDYGKPPLSRWLLRCSIQLSYRPEGQAGLEPATIKV